MKEMFYLNLHSTHFILWLYGIKNMVKDHSDSKRQRKPTTMMGYYFRLVARDLLYASSNRQDNTYHAFVIPVVEHWFNEKQLSRSTMRD